MVTRLDRTGGGAPAGPERAALEDFLKKEGVTNIKELFDSNTVSLVRVAARIPAGNSSRWCGARFASPRG